MTPPLLVTEYRPPQHPSGCLVFSVGLIVGMVAGMLLAAWVG